MAPKTTIEEPNINPRATPIRAASQRAKQVLEQETDEEDKENYVAPSQSKKRRGPARKQHSSSSRRKRAKSSSPTIEIEQNNPTTSDDDEEPTQKPITPGGVRSALSEELVIDSDDDSSSTDSRSSSEVVAEEIDEDEMKAAIENIPYANMLIAMAELKKSTPAPLYNNLLASCRLMLEDEEDVQYLGTTPATDEVVNYMKTKSAPLVERVKVEKQTTLLVGSSGKLKIIKEKVRVRTTEEEERYQQLLKEKSQIEEAKKEAVKEAALKTSTIRRELQTIGSKTMSVQSSTSSDPKSIQRMAYVEGFYKLWHLKYALGKVTLANIHFPTQAIDTEDDTGESLTQTLEFLSNLNAKTAVEQVDFFNIQFQETHYGGNQARILAGEEAPTDLVNADRIPSIDWMRDVVKFGNGFKRVTELAELSQVHLYVASYQKMQKEVPKFKNAMEDLYNSRYSMIKETIDNAKAAGKAAHLDPSDNAWWGRQKSVPQPKSYTEEEITTEIGKDFKARAIAVENITLNAAKFNWEKFKRFYLWGQRLQMLMDTIDLTLDDLISKKYKVEGVPPLATYYKMETIQCKTIMEMVTEKINRERGLNKVIPVGIEESNEEDVEPY